MRMTVAHMNVVNAAKAWFRARHTMLPLTMAERRLIPSGELRIYDAVLALLRLEDLERARQRDRVVAEPRKSIVVSTPPSLTAPTQPSKPQPATPQPSKPKPQPPKPAKKSPKKPATKKHPK